MDFALTELQQALHDEVLALASSFTPEYWLEHDRTEEYPWEFVRALAGRGWLGTIIPQEYGGAGLGITEAAVVMHAVCLSSAYEWGLARPLLHVSARPCHPLRLRAYETGLSARDRRR